MTFVFYNMTIESRCRYEKNHEVVGVVIDAIQQNDTLKFLSAILGMYN